MNDIILGQATSWQDALPTESNRPTRKGGSFVPPRVKAGQVYLLPLDEREVHVLISGLRSQAQAKADALHGIGLPVVPESKDKGMSKAEFEAMVLAKEKEKAARLEQLRQQGMALRAKQAQAQAEAKQAKAQARRRAAQKRSDMVTASTHIVRVQYRGHDPREVASREPVQCQVLGTTTVHQQAVGEVLMHIKTGAMEARRATMYRQVHDTQANAVQAKAIQKRDFVARMKEGKRRKAARKAALLGLATISVVSHNSVSPMWGEDEIKAYNTICRQVEEKEARLVALVPISAYKRAEARVQDNLFWATLIVARVMKMAEAKERAVKIGLALQAELKALWAGRKTKTGLAAYRAARMRMLAAPSWRDLMEVNA